MNKKIFIYMLTALTIVFLIIGLLIGLKIDYYERIPFDIRDGNVLVVLEDEPHSVFININSKVYEVHQWVHLTDNTYALEFSLNKDIDDKVFCYIATYKLNYLSYIFKIVFNI